MKYYKLINSNGWSSDLKQGVIYPGNYKTNPSFLTDVEYYATNGYAKDWEKSTKEAYNKQEGVVPKPRVKKVVEVSTHEFKIGDKVKFTDCTGRDDDNGDSNVATATFEHARKYCEKNIIYIVTEVSVLGSIKLVGTRNYWFNKLQFELSTQTKLKQAKMENYSIEGSKALKTAFVEECKLKVYSDTKINNERHLTSEDISKGTVQSTGTKCKQHFVLPKDWDAAVKYVTKFNAVPKFKNGDYVVVVKNTSGSCNKVGDIGILSRTTDRNTHVEAIPESRGAGNCHDFGDLRLATPAEIKKATTVVYKAGDIVVITDNNNGSINRVGDVGICVSELYRTGDQIQVKVGDYTGSSNWTMFTDMRIATTAEIKAFKAVPTFKMAGYDSSINKSAKTISFGCQTYTKAEVKLLLDATKLCERVGYSAKVKASGFVVNETDILTPDSLTKILAQLK